MRSLTLAGKITVLKSLIFSKIVFVSFLSNKPKCIIKNLIKLKCEFLWDGKPPKIKHSALVGSYERGGLKDIDIEKRIKALRISWVKRLYDETEHEWKIIPKFFLDKFSSNIFYPNLKIKMRCKLPTFYKNVVQEWEEIACCNPLTMENVMMQPICFNGKILVNGDVIAWKSAVNLFVQSFYDENGQIIDWSVFKQKNGKNETFFFKWRQILDAIPRVWKGIIERDMAAGQFCGVVPEPHLQVISRRITLSRLNGKEVYIILINKMCEKPTSEDKIEQELGETDLIWPTIYMLGRRITLDSYSRQFHFKITHNVLFLNVALKRMNLVESSMCSYCNVEDETTVHLFSGCQYVRGLWGNVHNFFRSKMILGEHNPTECDTGMVPGK
jgi:hypothetical protein